MARASSRWGEGPRLASHLRLWSGDSRGRWEGETLVVETTNIHPDQNDVIPRSVFANELEKRAGNQPSAERRVVERFTRVDEETLLYEFTVDDPVIYTEPWGGEIPMWRQHEQMYEYACHEANYGMFNIPQRGAVRRASSDRIGGAGEVGPRRGSVVSADHCFLVVGGENIDNGEGHVIFERVIAPPPSGPFV